jgi:hypothetical protein
MHLCAIWTATSVQSKIDMNIHTQTHFIVRRRRNVWVWVHIYMHIYLYVWVWVHIHAYTHTNSLHRQEAEECLSLSPLHDVPACVHLWVYLCLQLQHVELSTKIFCVCMLASMYVWCISKCTFVSLLVPPATTCWAFKEDFLCMHVCMFVCMYVVSASVHLWVYLCLQLQHVELSTKISCVHTNTYTCYLGETSTGPATSMAPEIYKSQHTCMYVSCMYVYHLTHTYIHK